MSKSRLKLLKAQQNETWGSKIGVRGGDTIQVATNFLGLPYWMDYITEASFAGELERRPREAHQTGTSLT